LTVLITGAAGFVGCKIVEYLYTANPALSLIGIDNLSRKGSEFNIPMLAKFNCEFFNGDISIPCDLKQLPRVDWIIDCAANPSVLAGLNNDSLSLINNNLAGTFYLLEKCKNDNAGFIMLSTSRVYSIEGLCSIPLIKNNNRFTIPHDATFPEGFSTLGVSEQFSTAAPISLYGATKLASEVLALEYHYSFGFQVWINRCGVIAGPGQFGKIDQGIFSYWIYQYLLNKPLSYIGFGGTGLQARDMVHPYDVFKLVYNQMINPILESPKIINIGGGVENTRSLAELNEFCIQHIDKTNTINSIPENRKYDIPYYATDYSIAQSIWNWTPSIGSDEILHEILEYGRNHLDHISRIS
jgi:CDP-paratose 2-epimerase